MYCIYTNKDVPEVDGNFDHIFPLSLGGLNQFCVWSDEEFNSKMGSKADGEIANDTLMMFARSKADARGHSGEEPTAVLKNSKLDGRPVQVSFGKETVTVWDAMSRTNLDESDVVGKQIESRLRLDRFAAIKFAAKVALGGAYYIYGDAILAAMDCDELRKLITLDAVAAKNDQKIRDMKTLICDRLHPDTQANQQALMFKIFCEIEERSILICVPHHRSISFHVGALGVHLCSLICPAKTDFLPNDAEDHDLGHAVILGPGSFERMSFRQLAKRYRKVFSSLEESSE